MRHALFTIVLACSAPAAAVTFEVNTTADKPDLTPADGQCLTAQGTCSLRAAIQQANATPGFDTVLLPSGWYKLHLTGGAGENASATGDLDILEPMALLGTATPGSPLGVEISNEDLFGGPNFDRILDIDTGDAQTPVHIDQISITFGSTGEALGGAGILLHAGSVLSMQDVALYGNFGASVGSAMAVYGKAVVHDFRAFDNHTLSPITAPNMLGTIYVGGHGELDGDNVAVDRNSAEVGGALAAVDNAVVSLRRASLYSDEASSGGGQGPDGGLGGGLYLAGQATVTLENSTLFFLVGITEDKATNSVVVRDDATLTMRHASLQALPVLTQGSGTASIHFADSLLFSSVGMKQQCSGNLVSEGGNWLTSTADCAIPTTSQDHVGNALLAKDVALYVPVPGSFGGNHLGLLHQVLLPTDGSGVDQASTATCPDVDQLQASRPTPSASGQPRLCDAGAVELPLDHLFVDGWDG